MERNNGKQWQKDKGVKITIITSPLTYHVCRELNPPDRLPTPAPVIIPERFFFCIFFGGLECVGHSFAYVALFVFLRDVWIRQRAAVASKGALPT
jgi:hypothetical protein